MWLIQAYDCAADARAGRFSLCQGWLVGISAVPGCKSVFVHGVIAVSSLLRSPALVIVVLTFSAVIYLIAELDRPQEGLFNVSQQAMVDLRNLLDKTNR
jgi:hypothetical protein